MTKFEQMIRSYMRENFGTGSIYIENGAIKTVQDEVTAMIDNLKEGYVDEDYLQDKETFMNWIKEWTSMFSVCIDNK